MSGKVAVQYSSGSDEFAFAARGEWICQDGVAGMVIQDHELFATTRRGDGKTSSLVSA